MSVNEWGTLKEPTLPVPPGEAEQSDTSRRAEHSSPGVWDEDLGRYGSDTWNLPGYGESGPRCGEWYPESVCTDCGHLDLGTHSCGRRSCSDCWGIWAGDAGARATKRVQAFRHTQPDNHRRQVAHAVVSPPEGAVMNEREFYNGRTKAAEIVEAKGFRGFAAIPHPWRVTDEGKDDYERLVPRDSDGEPLMGVWVWLRQEFDEAGLRERVYWSPHYHIIGVTSADMEPAKESDDWSYNFIRSLEPYDGIRDTSSHEDVYGAFRYLLSHTGFPEGSTKQAVTWYGDLANSVFVEEASAEWQTEKPSEGVRSALEREIEEVAGVTEDDDEDGVGGDEGDDVGDCPRDDCDGVLIDVFDVPMYLDHNDPPPDVTRRMMTAYEWRIGDVSPPPGMQRPQTREQALEAFEEMV